MREPRVEIALWSLQHSCGDTIECSVSTHPVGLELQTKLNAELLHRQVFSGPEELMRSAQRSRGVLESKGWAPVATGTST